MSSWLVCDSVFDNFLKSLSLDQRWMTGTPQTGFPVVDVYYTDDKAILEFALAGYKLEDLKVAVEGSVLIVSSDGCDNKDSPTIRRIARRRFKNTFTDRDNVYDLDNLVASFKDGILKVEISRKEQSKLKNIKILNS